MQRWLIRCHDNSHTTVTTCTIVEEKNSWLSLFVSLSAKVVTYPLPACPCGPGFRLALPVLEGAVGLVIDKVAVKLIGEQSSRPRAAWLDHVHLDLPVKTAKLVSGCKMSRLDNGG